MTMEDDPQDSENNRSSPEQEQVCESSSTTTSQEQVQQQPDDPNPHIPRLPPGDPENSKGLPSIKLGETIRFEEMGPIIINTDGTTRRIANWDQLSPQEQKATWRRISKRNEERRQQLLLLVEQEQPEQQEQAATNINKEEEESK
jgi:predicted Fe-S protein YdhL (DUF1289 family)